MPQLMMYSLMTAGLTLQQAYSHMKAKRPLIRPNDGFWRQLISYERDLKRRKQVRGDTLTNRIQINVSVTCILTKLKLKKQFTRRSSR